MKTYLCFSKDAARKFPNYVRVINLDGEDVIFSTWLEALNLKKAEAILKTSVYNYSHVYETNFSYYGVRSRSRLLSEFEKAILMS